jgi:hypothetical protein
VPKKRKPDCELVEIHGPFTMNQVNPRRNIA